MSATQDILQTAWTRRKDIRFRRVGDEAVVLAQEAAEVLVLNEVGARVLELASEGRPAESWLGRLLEEYEVEEAALRTDVERYLRQLLDKGVLVAVE